MEKLSELLSLLVKVGEFTEFVSKSDCDKIEFYVEYKDDMSPVTFADLGVQLIITAWLTENFNGFSLIAEESLNEFFTHLRKVVSVKKLLSQFGVEIGVLDMIRIFRANRLKEENPRSFWVLDPVDGTKGFLRGGQYAISLAYVEEGRVKAGFLVCPRLGLPELLGVATSGCIFFAEDGKGAWIMPLCDVNRKVSIKVSNRVDFKESVLLCSYESTHTDREKTEKFKSILGINREVFVDSQVKYGLLACGLGDLMLRFPPKDQPDYREKIWDHAGGAIVLQEAGGRLTDLYGGGFEFKPFQYFHDNVGVFASNGILHPRGLEVLRTLMGD
ncbi:MAG: 3'(2'),5'-bisphosphate nucleotidase [Candidatus Hydrogenedentes bacterium]|nr:3'(2'),5'-bisphosphate nucleotidase [Candidatus Hydrogenedentota bacterium]